VAAQVAAAGGIGVRAAFIAEDIGCRDTFQVVALAANANPDAEFTIAVTNPYLRSPYALAEALVTVNELARGRVSLGLGSSSADIISGQLGLDHAKPVRVMRETVFTVREECRRIDRGFRPSIHLAAMGPLMLRLAGELADGVILNTGTTPRYISWARGQIAKGLARTGRESGAVSISVWLPAYVDEDDSAAMPRARRWAARMLSIPRQGELLLEHAGFDDTSFLEPLRAACSAYPHAGDVDRGVELVPDEVVRTLALIGSPECVVQRLPPYLDQGADTLILGLRPLARVADWILKTLPPSAGS
jgi:alkanesulfonate monooxygenase SsuD/methylene tetrahydromethanopterin reductase-like flavin-dependent oxidoreductase (luciferase family)